jgi:hypothetical protein
MQSVRRVRNGPVSRSGLYFRDLRRTGRYRSGPDAATASDDASYNDLRDSANRVYMLSPHCHDRRQKNRSIGRQRGLGGAQYEWDSAARRAYLSPHRAAFGDCRQAAKRLVSGIAILRSSRCCRQVRRRPIRFMHRRPGCPSPVLSPEGVLAASADRDHPTADGSSNMGAEND